MSEDNELITVDANEITISRAPEVVLAEAKQACDALKRVLETKPNKVIIKGKQFLEFDDWQLVGKFYGLTVKVESTTLVEFGGVQGWQASAVVLDKVGNEISRAESMCLNDEDEWGAKNKKPLFQLRSMAQTRACAKAYRNVLSWVVVLAGFAPGTAEEMTGDEQGKPTPQAPAQKAAPASDKRRAKDSLIAEMNDYLMDSEGKVADEDFRLLLEDLTKFTTDSGDVKFCQSMDKISDKWAGSSLKNLRANVKKEKEMGCTHDTKTCGSINPDDTCKHGGLMCGFITTPF